MARKKTTSTMLPSTSWRGGDGFVYSFVFAVCFCLSMISTAVFATKMDENGGGVDDATEYFFANQIVDHLDPINNANRTWTQRYYMSDKHFGGPGSPIFIILGGGKYHYVSTSISPLIWCVGMERDAIHLNES